MRLRLQQLCGGIRELARHGPMKPPDKAGLDEVCGEYVITDMTRYFYLYIARIYTI
jgi:hypothetical protein